MNANEENGNYRFGKLTKFAQGNLSIAKLCEIKSLVFFTDENDPDAIESIRRAYITWVSFRNDLYAAKEIYPNLTIDDDIQRLNKLIPLFDTMPESSRLNGFAGWLYGVSQNPDMEKHFISNANMVLQALGKSVSQIRAEFLADPLAKPIVLQLEKDLQSENAIRRVIAANPTVQDISNMAKALPDELCNEPLTVQTVDHNSRMIYRKVLFRGTPKRFYEFTQQLNSEEFNAAHARKERVIHFDMPIFDNDMASMRLYPSRRNVDNANRAYASIKALAHPDGYSIITLEVTPIDWAGIEKYWNEFIEILEKEKLRLDMPSADQLAHPEKPKEITKYSERTEALNKLAVLWVEYNQNERISKNDDMEWFLGEYASQVGLQIVSKPEFKKHLPKAKKAQIIDFDPYKKRYIPLIGNSNGNS